VDDRTEVEQLESLLQACHGMMRNLERASVRDDGLSDALREACRRIEARLERLIAAA
jgi:hypothetical protein